MDFLQIIINQKVRGLMKSNLFIALFVFLSGGVVNSNAQTLDVSVLQFNEFLGYVKKHHPIVKQAELVIDASQAQLMKARGGFDPKIEVDYDRKKFENSEYYNKLNASFKIPTWYGIELKANFEEADGLYVNPENNLPEDGLYSAGISFSLAQGLVINERVASLKKAKLFREQAKADRDILVNTILYEAALAYFKWLQLYNETLIFEEFLNNATIRYNGIKKSVEVGEAAAIDSVEAKIAVNDRKLSLEKSRIQLLKAKLQVSNYLWLQNNIPVELEDAVIPDVHSELIVDKTLNIDNLIEREFLLETHPKLQSLNYKSQSLNIEKQLKGNMLLPVIDFQYNFLSETPNVSRSFNTSSYKSGLNISFPLFLRKERGDLKLAKVKLQDVEYEIVSTKLNIQNKILGIKQELNSYTKQNMLLTDILSDYQRMVSAEERKFNAGESSLFLINNRESKLIDAKLKAAELENKFLSTKALLFNNLAVNPEF